MTWQELRKNRFGCFFLLLMLLMCFKSTNFQYFDFSQSFVKKLLIPNARRIEFHLGYGELQVSLKWFVSTYKLNFLNIYHFFLLCCIKEADSWHFFSGSRFILKLNVLFTDFLKNLRLATLAIILLFLSEIKDRKCFYNRNKNRFLNINLQIPRFTPLTRLQNLGYAVTS